MSKTTIRIANVNSETIKSKEDILKELPFPYNEDNSNISIIAAHSDGNIDISVKFGTGKGWDTLEDDMREAMEEANSIDKSWNNYERDLIGDYNKDELDEDEIGDR